MSNADELLSKGTFDLRAVLQERAYPTDTVEFYIDEEVGYAARKLLKILADLGNQLAIAQNVQDKALITEIGKQIKAAESKLEELRQGTKPYIATIRSISRRSKRNIQSQALHRVPMSRDLYGRDSAENELARADEITKLLWTASLVSVQSPGGVIQEFGGDEALVSGIMDGLPESGYKAIDAKINELLDDGELFEFKAQDQDFSSES